MIFFRIQQAGYRARMDLFLEEALKEIYQYTRGYPRQVTMLCHRSLKEMLMKNKAVVDREPIPRRLPQRTAQPPRLAGGSARSHRGVRARGPRDADDLPDLGHARRARALRRHRLAGDTGECTDSVSLLVVHGHDRARGLAAFARLRASTASRPAAARSPRRRCRADRPRAPASCSRGGPTRRVRVRGRPSLTHHAPCTRRGAGTAPAARVGRPRTARQHVEAPVAEAA